MENRLERLNKIKYHLARGITQKEMARLLEVTEQTIHRDIVLIRSQLISKLKKQPIDELLFKLRLNLDQVTKEYWELAGDSKHKNIQLGALNSILKANEMEIHLMERLGVFEFVEKHNIEVKSDINEFKNFLSDRAKKVNKKVVKT